MAQASQVMDRRPGKPKEAAWWIQPAYTVTALGLFGLYSIWEVFTHNTGRFENYLSPFFSPDMHSWFHFLPALYVVWAPLLFRATCYYYRKAYYRSFFFDPPSCALPEPKGRTHYRGETKLPLILNNLHRFFFYLAVVVLVFLWKDAIDAFFFKNGFGVGLGSIIMLVNVVFLSIYTFSCHAFRHLVGGNLDCFSCGVNPRLRYNLWQLVSNWNADHAMWAWISMFTVWGTDLYIRLLIMGVLHPVRFF